MSRIKLCLFTLIIGFFTTTIFASSQPTNSPVGYWKTVDDVTGKPKSIVHIWKADNEALMGKVIKLFPSKRVAQNKFCTACDGEQRNKPIVGMVILSGLKANQAQWNKGHILDPENGRTYKCSVRVADNGKQLNVHGYVGIPLLGRSQTWQRIDLMSDK